jgi:cytochrome b involved in lipid metabolism
MIDPLSCISYVVTRVTSRTITMEVLRQVPFTHSSTQREPKPYKPKFDFINVPKYFTPAEISSHSTEDDIWVSWLGNVYNLTPLIKENKGNF